MEAYRDQYAKLFGKNVVVMALSTDVDTAQASWAHDSDFPMLFLSDTSHVAGKAYGMFDEKRKQDVRGLFVVGPDGRITYRTFPFRVTTQSAYDDLGEAVHKTAPQ